MINAQTLVFGEPIGVFVEALRPFVKNARVVNGVWRSHATIEQRLGEPLQRALMRAEAELLLRDADQLGSQAYEDRTSDQRRADALVELAQRMGATAKRK